MRKGAFIRTFHHVIYVYVGAKIDIQDEDGWLAKDHLEYGLQHSEGKSVEQVEKAKFLHTKMDREVRKKLDAGIQVYAIKKKAVSRVFVVEGEDSSPIAIGTSH